MRKHNFAFIDIETTGLDIIKNEIIEIGVVLTTPALKVIEEFSLKIKPEHIETADPVALKVNHYNEEDWAHAITLSEAMNIFADKVRDCIMVGHNVSFDSGFIEYTLTKLGIKHTLHYHKLDTVSIAFAKLVKDSSVEHFSLRELCLHFDIKNQNFHTGLGDARATYELYKKLMEL